ncbi:hypothetical protein Syun_006630 [Stephania yunnanensis]|uniref:Uncharacterized protein n=1 Tax=Stephania yunnanensis TaxID=152371 RepID=A0AAP0L0D3_9MAGN
MFNTQNLSPSKVLAFSPVSPFLSDTLDLSLSTTHKSANAIIPLNHRCYPLPVDSII